MTFRKKLQHFLDEFYYREEDFTWEYQNIPVTFQDLQQNHLPSSIGEIYGTLYTVLFLWCGPHSQLLYGIFICLMDCFIETMTTTNRQYNLPAKSLAKKAIYLEMPEKGCPQNKNVCNICNAHTRFSAQILHFEKLIKNIL